MSRTALGPVTELGCLLGRPSEQLHERGARGREPLGHLRGHRGVVLGPPLALECADPLARPVGPG